MPESNNKLSSNFAAFFSKINPSKTYKNIAASAHSNITSLIEKSDGPAKDYKIKCFLQGSYKRNTAIHTINDVDIIAACDLSYKESANQNTRNQIFKVISDSIGEAETYREKIKFNNESVCVKVLLSGIKIEILPALKIIGKPIDHEPFYTFLPNNNFSGSWKKTYAKKHQVLCTQKNSQTDGLFIPLIKVFKHLRFIENSLSETIVPSFYIECLLYALKNTIYSGSISDCIEAVLQSLAGFSADKAYQSGLKSPCKDEVIFGTKKWCREDYNKFNSSVKKWYEIVKYANQLEDKDKAIDSWKSLLGDSYFVRNPA